MKLKRAVKLAGMTDPTLKSLVEVDRLVREEFALDIVVTSANDQPEAHSKNSRHGKGRAFDLRLPSRLVTEKFFGKWDKKIARIDKRVTERIRERLGASYDVILEDHQQTAWNWHIHVEHDPS